MAIIIRGNTVFGTRPYIVGISAYNSSMILKSDKVWEWGNNSNGQLGDNTIIDRSTPVTIVGNIKTFCQISCGRHSLGLDFRGKVWSWGYNVYGQLGDNTIDNKSTPVAVCGNKTFCLISASFYNSLGIDFRGKVWSWGYNVYGQLGDNTIVDRYTPIAVSGTTKTFCQISTSFYNSLGIDFRGKVWSWGRNNFGQLGINSTVSNSTPIAVLGTNKTFCQISGGKLYSLGIDFRGKLWSWGYNQQGQLGVNSILSKLTPVAVLGTNKTFCQISISDSHSLGLDFRGKLWSWGQNTYGQLGDNSIIGKCTPVSVYGNRTFCKISAGGNHSLGLDFHGKLWGWGGNTESQLTGYANKSIPMSTVNKTFCKISTGVDHTIGIDFSGTAWSWGRNDQGQLGDNTIISKIIPNSVYGNKTFCKISGGYVGGPIQGHSLAIDNRGILWSWGNGSRGQLGVGSVLSKRTPVAVCGNHTFCHITAGYLFSLGIDQYGKGWSWGHGFPANIGQLGDNTTTQKTTPVAICGSHTFCKISSGDRFSIGLDFRGKSWSWGYNVYGQLGDNTATNKSTPVAVLGVNKTFCKISGGQYHTLGLDFRGKLWGWGYNNWGQLGDNTTVNKYTPVAIIGTNKTFCRISAGKLHSMGIDFRGKLWSWGFNFYGQLGDNSTVDKYTPVAVCGDKTFCQISKSGNSMVVIDNNGKIWGWGINNYGQLGIGESSNVLTPKLINI
jgi:alpha-tubulin suppressor-like RCC1 family protein